MKEEDERKRGIYNNRDHPYLGGPGGGVKKKKRKKKKREAQRKEGGSCVTERS